MNSVGKQGSSRGYLWVLIVGCFGLLSLSCASPPPVETVKYLIRVDRGNCMFHTLHVEDIGPYNEEEDYWPVTVRMKGACDGGMRTVKIDQTEVFLFYEEGKEYWRFRQ
jgi:hypothetical protein